MALFSLSRTGKVPIFLPYCDGLKMELLSANSDDEARTNRLQNGSRILLSRICYGSMETLFLRGPRIAATGREEEQCHLSTSFLR